MKDVNIFLLNLNCFHVTGDCKNGVCYCHAGFAGDDCSLSKSSIPDVFFAPFCDVSEEECGNAEIYGNGFIKSDDLTCIYQPAEVSVAVVYVFCSS